MNDDVDDRSFSKIDWIGLVFVALIGISIPYLSHAYYHFVEKPSIIKTTPWPIFAKEDYSPLDAKHAPADFDLVFVKTAGDSVEEHYFSSGGERRTVKYVNNRWLSYSTYSVAERASFFYTILGFVLLYIAAFVNSKRTGSWFYYPNFFSRDREPATYHEKRLIAYGSTMFFAANFGQGLL